MTVAALLLTPVVLLYQGWTYHVFRERVGGDEEGAERGEDAGAPPTEAEPAV
jgi:hypothetical protein